jgi:hydroxyethylthiazole kinase-like uncharacterized protein yjeF
MGGSWTAADVAKVLRRPTDADDKYSRGVLGIRTGSELYPGAAVLGVEAAWRTGVGMVRYVGAARDLVLQRRPETVTQDGRVQAWLIGSGMDASARASDETEALRAVLGGSEPVVADAGALDLVGVATAPLVVTPHAREHARLRQSLGLAETHPDGVDARSAAAAETAEALGGVVLLKGAMTVVAAPGGWTATVAVGTPWLATAGTGDVLGGALGALVAGAAAGADGAPGLEAMARAAASAAWLHGRAADLAAAAWGRGGGPITALDVADALPRAVAEVLGSAT